MHFYCFYYIQHIHNYITIVYIATVPFYITYIATCFDISVIIREFYICALLIYTNVTLTASILEFMYLSKAKI
jgi:hypothetical protein